MPHSPVIIVLSEHPVFGMLLIPYIAESTSQEGLCLTEQAFHLSPKAVAQLSETEQKVIEIASHYTEKYLMTVYSKEKTISKFLRKLSEDPEKLKKIRLFIEKKLAEMMELIRTHNLLLYQKQTGSKLLYPHHAYHVHKEDVITHFSFKVDNHSFSYQLKCYDEGKAIPLMELKPAVALTSNPAILLLGMEVYIFRHIEAARLLPFTKKAQICVDASFTEKYIDNILIPIASYHDIDVQGLDIRKEEKHCDCLLYVEETIYSAPLLRLNFRYDEQLFTPQPATEVKKYFSRNVEDGKNRICYFQRDTDKEEEVIRILQSIGLERINDSHFKLSENIPEKSVTEWITRYRTQLQDTFILTSDQSNIPYCLDEIRIEQSYDDGPDWFELHITVVIGDLRIPFSRFRKHILEERREYTLPNGQVILLPEEWFSKYANLMEMGTLRGKDICVKRPFMGIVESIMQSNSHKEFTLPQFQQKYPVPTGIKARLRPYQQKGYTWMMNLYKQELGGCLADDMGLGKTLQTLALLQNIYNQKNDTEKEEEEEKKETTLQESGSDQKDKSGQKDENGPKDGNDQENGSEIPEKQDLNLMLKDEPVSIDEMGQFELFRDLTAENTLDRCGLSGRTSKATRKPSTLIVVPTSLLHNWKREASRFTTLSMAEYNSNSHYKAGHPELFFNRFHLIFVSYGTMRNKLNVLRQYCFEYIVLDESQNIKNSDSLTFRSAIQLHSHHRLVLTGTPIENSLKDLWAQFHFLQPDLLGDENTFTKQFINPIKLKDPRMELRLRQLIAPFILRRSKSEVAPELPPLTEEIIYCDMAEPQDAIYQQEKNSLRNTLLQLSPNRKQHQQFTVLNGISRLRQLACHPQMVLPDYKGYSGKMEQIIDIYGTLRSEGHKVLIFSSFVKHLELIAAEFQKHGWQYALLTGSSTNRPEEIARFAETEEIQAFLISLKAGGVGLNLTQADYVFIVDPWWNPAAEAQAIARAHRIGQNRQVIAYRFITKDSIEEKIIRLQESKRQLAETFITESESIPVLTDREWIGLLE